MGPRGSGQCFEYPEHSLAFLGRMLQAGCVSSQGPCFSWHSQHPRGVCCINDRDRAAWASPSGVGSGMGREAARHTGRDERAQSVVARDLGKEGHCEQGVICTGVMILAPWCSKGESGAAGWEGDTPARDLVSGNTLTPSEEQGGWTEWLEQRQLEDTECPNTAISLGLYTTAPTKAGQASAGRPPCAL